VEGRGNVQILHVTCVYAIRTRVRVCVRICVRVCMYIRIVRVQNLRAFVRVFKYTRVYLNTHVYAGVYKYAHTYEDVSRAHTRVRRQWSGRAGIGWRSRLRASKYGTVSAVHS